MDSSIKLTILGDVCPTEDYQGLFNQLEASVFTDILSLIEESDFSICNLECPATKQSRPIIKAGPNLKANPDILQLLKSADIKAVSLANNHILDYGEQGVLETLEGAKEAGIAYFGGGKDKEEAAKGLMTEIKGKKIGFLSFAEHEFNLATENSAGANGFDPYISLPQITAMKECCDFIIVLYHGGIEHYKYPSPLLQKKCRAMVDVGADVVLCQHSHCIGTYEKYHGAEILYGQGNSVFGYREGNIGWNQGLLVQIHIKQEKLEISYRLLEATAEGVRLAQEKDEEARLAEFVNDSQAICSGRFIEEQWRQFCKRSEPWYLPMLLGWNRVAIKGNRILKNKLIQYCFGKRARMTTMNLLRCDAHKEVLDEILKQ